MMNNILKLSQISIVAAFALTSCTGGGYDGSSNSTNSVTQTSYINKLGLEGNVIAQTYIKNAKVCFDINANGSCDNDEPSEYTYDNGKFSFSKFDTTRGKSKALLAEINNEYILTAQQKDNNQVISPFTSLTYSDIVFNPNTNASENDSASQLVGTSLGLNLNYLKGEDYLKSANSDYNFEARDIIRSLKKAYVLDKSKALETIASTLDKMVKENNFVVDVTSITNQNRYDSLYSLNKNTKVSDINIDSPSTSVQKTASIVNSDQRVIVQSVWNNKLTMIDSSTLNEVDSNVYLNGNNGDTTSGPSEKRVSKLISNSTNTEIYSLLRIDDASDDYEGLGIYHASYTKDSLPTNAYNSYASTNKDYFSNASLKDISLSNDENNMLATSSNNSIYFLDAKDLSKSEIINTTSPAQRASFGSLDTYFYVSYSNALNTYEKSSKNLINSFNVGAQIQQIVPIDGNSLLISFVSSNEIKLLDVSDKNNIVITRTFTSPSNIKKFHLSKNKKNISVTLVNSSNIMTFLVNDENVKLSYNANIIINDFNFISNTKLVAISNLKAFYFDLLGNGLAPTSSDKTDWTNAHR